MTLQLGKLPVDVLAHLLAKAPIADPDVLVGPAPGMDCAVVDVGDRLLVIKSDPITFTGEKIGRYLVQVNANDVATTGATPRWLLVTALLPEGADEAMAAAIMDEIVAACGQLNISLIGGHTEVTHGLTRPILAGTMLGEVARDRLVTPRGAKPGDCLLLTKGVPIEGTAILAREFTAELAGVLSPGELEEAAAYLYDPGISVVRDARVALGAGNVTAMHDPTEGGVAAAFWELAEASGRRLQIDKDSIPIPELAGRICAALGLDPLATIASGALLLAVDRDDAAIVQTALHDAGITCAAIGRVLAGEAGVWIESDGGQVLMKRPERDALALLFEAESQEARSSAARTHSYD